MDYYSTLGLKRGASPDDIKKAYRGMAMKHHPDRGGDEKTFKQIEEAYRFLSDPEKKHIIDQGGNPNAQAGRGGGHNQGPFEFHFGAGNFDDVFSQFGFGGGFARQQRRNKSYSVNVEVSLEDILTGKNIDAEIGVSGGKNKIINISIPPGIEHGQQIRYQGMGDDSVQGVGAGDLIVNVFVRPHTRFSREGDSLITDLAISAWDAILGKSYNLTSIDGASLDIKIPAGTQPGQVVRCQGYGLPNVRTKQRGHMLIRIKVDVPKNLTAEQQQLVEQLRNAV